MSAMFVISITTFLLMACGIQLSHEEQLIHVDNPNTDGMDSPPEPDSSPFHSFSPNIYPPFSASSLGRDQLQTFQFANNSLSPSIIASNAANTFADLVNAFTLRFIQGIEADEKLKNAFALQRLTADQATELMYDIVFNAHSGVNGDDQIFSAQAVSEALRTHFGHATTGNIIRLYANCVGKYLFYHGLLTTENVQSLAEKYLKYVKDGVYSVTGLSQEDAFRGVAKGFLDFMAYANLYRQDNAASFATYFINELLSI